MTISLDHPVIAQLLETLSQSTAPKTIAIVGATATGKTALSIQLAKALNTEIISADSQQVYTGLDIGTAKPTLLEREGIPHHCIDMVLPSESFSIANYLEAANRQKNRLETQGKTPIVAGGTGFYFSGLLQKRALPDVPEDPQFRQALQEHIQQEGLETLYQELQGKDPRRAQQLYPQDAVRIIRALEIIHITGQPVPNLPSTHDQSDDSTLWIGLTYGDTDAQRDYHRHIMAKRVDDMLNAGWLGEVQKLMDQYGPNAEALQVAHGYPEWVSVLLGERDFEDAKAQVILNVHQYARRQRTWFKRNKAIQWISVTPR